MTQQIFNDSVLIDGSQDVEQLRVQGNTTQNQPLQTWEDSAGDALVQVTADGRVQLGDDLGFASPDALIEAHRAEASTAKPKRGFHSLGQISDSLTNIAQWIVQELEVRGANNLSALQTALRVRASNMNTGTPSAGAELRAADIEVINDATAGSAALPLATGLQVAVTNAAGKTITQATGLHVKLDNSGTITTPYAIFTEGAGVTHLDDYVEMKRPAAAPGTPVTDYLRVYSKADGKLYAKNWLGVEYDLTGGSGGGGASVAPSLVNGRLTLTSGTPMTTSDVTGAATLYFTPFHGNQIALFNGSNWAAYTFTERSLSLSGLVASKNHDIFIYDNSGTLTLEAVAWTNDTTRATALVSQDGVWVKSGATSHRYLGSIRTTNAGQTEDSAKKRLVYNEYQRFARKLLVFETASSWTYSTNAWRSANNNTNNRVEMIIGNPGIFINLNLVVRAGGSGSGGVHGIGYDTTTTTSADVYPNLSNDGHFSVHLVHAPAVGYHYYQWVENARGNSVTVFSGTAGAFEFWYGRRSSALEPTKNRCIQSSRKDCISATADDSP